MFGVGVVERDGEVGEGEGASEMEERCKRGENGLDVESEFGTFLERSSPM